MVVNNLIKSRWQHSNLSQAAIAAWFSLRKDATQQGHSLSEVAFTKTIYKFYFVK